MRPGPSRSQAPSKPRPTLPFAASVHPKDGVTVWVNSGRLGFPVAYVRTSSTHPRGEQEESDLARRRRRSALAARRPRDRDDRPLQPADRAVRDRHRRGARQALARARRAAYEHGQEAPARQGHLLARTPSMDELLEFLAKSLVDDPDAVSVASTAEEDAL